MSQNFESLLNACSVEELGAGDQYELVIFELHHLIIAEVLRGSVSETIVFKNHPEVRAILFGDDAIYAIGLDRLRADPKLGAHVLQKLDHMFLWQPTLQRWLFSQNIQVDDGVKTVPGVPPRTNQLIGGQLAITWSAQDGEKRERSVQKWKRNLDRAEEAARVRWRRADI